MRKFFLLNEVSIDDRQWVSHDGWSDGTIKTASVYSEARATAERQRARDHSSGRGPDEHLRIDLVEISPRDAVRHRAARAAVVLELGAEYEDESFDEEVDFEEDLFP